MATGSFILRPSADVSIGGGHSLHPSDSTSAYLLINEEVADDDATYLRADGGSSSSESTFTLGGAAPNEPFIVTGITLFVRDRCSSETGSTAGFKADLSCGETTEELSFDSAVTTDAAYKTRSTFSATFAKTINSAMKESEFTQFPALTLTIKPTPQNTGGGSKETNNEDYYITQAYVQVDYDTEIPTDIGVHQKVNGAWVAATAAYQKQNGAWVEITAEECKELLQNSLCLYFCAQGGGS